MDAVEELITENIDVWTSAVKRKSSAGRGGGKKIELYGVKKLRELILDLAVRGLLVPQDPSDEPASVLLAKVGQKKLDLIEDGKWKSSKTLLPISHNAKILEIPANWEQVTFGSILDFNGGSQPPKSTFSDIPQPGYVQLIQIRDLGPKPQPIFVPEEKVTKFCTVDDVMIGRYGASVGKVFWGKDGAYNVALIKLQNELGTYTKEFLYMLMLAPIGQSMFSGISRSAQAGFSKKDIEQNVIPVPPLPEQNRIVAKVDELMALCDQLEQQTESSLTVHKTLVQTLLGALTQAAATQPNDRQNAVNAPTPFTQAWNRLAEHFDTVFTTEDSIEQLKQTILQLAVMGKLVPQDPNDEPASELLKRIAVEKDVLVKAKKIKKQNALPEIGEEERPFALPDGWEWARFFSVNTANSKLVSATDHPTTFQVAPDSIEKNTGRITQKRTVEQSGAKGPNSIFHRGQLLYSKIRPSLNKVAIAPYDGLCSADMYPIDCHINSSYMLKAMLSEVFLPQVRIAENRVKMPKINLASLGSFTLPVPPLEEQQRIVEKLNELISLCDQLKSHLTDAQTTQLRLADAVTDQVIH